MYECISVVYKSVSVGLDMVSVVYESEKKVSDMYESISVVEKCFGSA